MVVSLINKIGKISNKALEFVSNRSVVRLLAVGAFLPFHEAV